MLALLLQPSCTNVTHDNLHEMFDIMIEICIGGRLANIAMSLHENNHNHYSRISVTLYCCR